MSYLPFRKTLQPLRKMQRERRCIIRGFGKDWYSPMTRDSSCRRLGALPGFNPRDTRGRKRTMTHGFRNFFANCEIRRETSVLRILFAQLRWRKKDEQSQWLRIA